MRPNYGLKLNQIDEQFHSSTRVALIITKSDEEIERNRTPANAEQWLFLRKRIVYFLLGNWIYDGAPLNNSIIRFYDVRRRQCRNTANLECGKAINQIKTNNLPRKRKGRRNKRTNERPHDGMYAMVLVCRCIQFDSLPCSAHLNLHSVSLFVLLRSSAK